MGRRLALLIATYEYRDAGLRQLTAPAHDAEEFAAVLADPAIAGFEVTTLVNEPHHVVGQAIGDFYRDRRRDDLTLLYFTGHGLKDDDGRLYLAMADTARDNLLFTALSAEQVDRAMENCVSRQKVLVLDCCYSGAFPAGRIAKADTAVHSLERFRGRGRTVLTASDAIEYSFEGDHPHGQVRQSVFTRHLVAGLRNGSADLDGDGDITLDELYTYVHDRVVEEMPQQRPKKQDNVEGRTVIARNVNWTLPGYLRNAIKSPIAADRLAALEGLAHLSRIGNETVRSQVLEETRRLAEDDSKQVSAAAQALLGESDAVRDEPIARRDAEPARQPTPPVPASATEPEPTQVVRQPVHDAPERPAEQAEQAPVIAPAQHAPRKPKPAALRVSARPVWLRWVLEPAWSILAALLGVLLIGVVVMVQLFDNTGEHSATSPDPRPEAFAVLSDFTDEVNSVEFSSDGDTLVTTSGTEADLWDVTGQSITAAPAIHDLAATPDGGQVEISPDGKTLATAPDGSTAQLWDVDTGQVTATFPSHQGWALKQFSPDGEILATAGTCACVEDFDNPVQLWNTTSGELIRSLSGHVNGVQSMEFSPDGTTLAAGAAGGGPVQLWNVTTGAPTTNLTAGYMVKFSPDGKILATSGEFTPEEKAQLWDVTTGKVIATLAEGDPIAFSPDGKTLLTANPRTSNPETTEAHLWRVPSGTIIPATLVTTPMAFASDNKSLAIADTDGTVRLWDFISGTTTHTFVGHTGLVNDLAISPDGKTLATAGKDQTVRLWHLGMVQ